MTGFRRFNNCTGERVLLTCTQLDARLSLRDVFSMFLLHNSDNDPILKTVFWTASVAVDYVWTLLQSYVNL